MKTTTMIRPEDIRSLTDFTRNTKANLARLRQTGRPQLLTVNGKAEVVVQNAAAYQRLLEALEKLQRKRRETEHFDTNSRGAHHGN